MRQLILIASVVALLMYAGFASQAAGGIPVTGARVPAEPMAALERGLEATGAKLTRVTILGWVRMERKNGADDVRKALGWTGAAPQGEVRDSHLSTRDGAQYLSVRWELPGDSSDGWVFKQAAVRRALALGGKDPFLTVQLEGEVAGSQPTALTAAALNALGAVERQDWEGPSAASSAGRSAQLPPSMFGVNVQVAARQDDRTGNTRIWLAWPALQQEY